MGVARSAEVLVAFPQLGPGFVGWSANEDIRMVVALFVVNAERVAIVASEAAAGKDSVRLVPGDSQNDEGGG
jgi:hypothetical protein